MHLTQARCGECIENGRDTAEAVGVSNARPPEFMHDPGIGIDHRCEFFRKKGRATLLTSLSARNDDILRLRDDLRAIEPPSAAQRRALHAPRAGTAPVSARKSRNRLLFKEQRAMFPHRETAARRYVAEIALRTPRHCAPQTPGS